MALLVLYGRVTGPSGILDTTSLLYSQLGWNRLQWNGQRWFSLWKII